LIIDISEVSFVWYVLSFTGTSVHEGTSTKPVPTEKEMGTMLDESVVRNEYNALCARIGEERAYRTLAMKFHTDTGDQPNAIAFQHLEKICEKFKDNKKRTKELEGQAMERQGKKKEMDELAAKKQCSLTNLEKLRAATEKERQKRQRDQDRKTARMNAESGGAIAPVVAPPTSFETVTEPCPPAMENEGSALTFTAEQEDVATISDTLLPPNTAALGIFESIVTVFSTLKIPKNGLKEYDPSTITSKKIHPIRMLLQNQLVPIPSDEPDFWTILDMVDKQNIPKSTHLHKKLPSAIKFFRELRELNPSLQCTTASSETDLVRILDNVATRTDIPKTDDAQLSKLPTAAKWFLKVLRSNVGDDSPVAPRDTTVSPPVEETIESDATPMSSLQEDAHDTPPVQEDASDAPPVQEDASPPPDAPQQSMLVTDTKRPSRTNSTATKRTKEQDFESTTEEVTRPLKMQKSNTLKCNTDIVFKAVESGEITLPNTRKGKPYASSSISNYCNKARKLLNGDVVGVAIDPNETNPFRVLDNAMKNTLEAIKTEDLDRNHHGQLLAGVNFFLKPKLRKQFEF
jgi:hypothetical protein